MTPHASQRRAGALATATAAAAVGMGSAARAQQPAPPEEGGPIIVGQRDEQFESFVIERIEAVLELMARYRAEERRAAGSRATRDTQEIFRPSLQISADAYIVHPNFIDLTLTGRLLLENETLDTESIQLREETTTLDTNYDFRALILGQSSMPVTAYSRRTQTNIDRLFGPSFDSIITEHGGIVQFVNDRAPTTVQYFHRDQEQTDARGLLDFGVVQDSFDIRSNILLSARQTLSLEYTMDAVEQSGANRAALEFVRHDATALHTYFLDDDREDELRSRIRWFEQTGDEPFRRITIDESLRLRHTDRFQTRYDVFYESREREDSNQDFLRGNFNLRHRLFESLVTTANLGASTLDVDGFTSNEYFGDIALDYTKKVPLGLLSATVSASHNIRDDGPRGELLRIFDDARTFSDPAPIIIARQNILPGSIVITDLSGLIFYDEGLDYTVDAFVDRVEIRRVIGGSILDGQTVLIDYTIGPEPASTVSTTGLGTTARYDIAEGPLRGLGVYVRYFQRDADIDSPDPTFFILDETRDLIFGADYNTGPLTVSAEYEQYDSTISPFDATRFEARYVHALGRGSSVNVTAAYQMIDFPSIPNHVDLALVTAGWNQQLTDTLRLSAQLVWRDERDDRDGHSNGFEQRLNLNWRHRQTEIYVSGRNSFFDSPTEERTAQSLEVGFRRTF
ncbi:MAG: porin [Phycisphaerales bacterium]|nr:porin [Phycisphaerales bacterium]